MKVIGSCLALAALLASGPCRADPPLAGGALYTASHGQPFCRSEGELRELLRAQVSHGPYGFGPEEYIYRFPSCTQIEDNALVTVLADEPSGNRYDHIVRARAAVLFGVVEGFTYSAGLSPYPNVQSHKLPHIFY